MLVILVNLLGSLYRNLSKGRAVNISRSFVVCFLNLIAIHVILYNLLRERESVFLFGGTIFAYVITTSQECFSRLHSLPCKAPLAWAEMGIRSQD